MPVADTPVARLVGSLSTRGQAGESPAPSLPFAETFLAAGSFGTRAVRLEDFALAMPKRKQLMDSLGCKSSELIALEEMRLGSRHVLASARWCFVFAQEGEAEQRYEVDSSYVVDTGTEDTGTEAMKIVLYIAHQDVLELAKAGAGMKTGMG